MFARTSHIRVVLLVAVALLAVWHADAGKASGAEVVGYRLTQSKTIHLDDQKMATRYDQTLRGLGCESKLHAHGGHIDLTYRCPQWKQIDLDTHDKAHAWERWLKALGFQTSHRH